MIPFMVSNYGVFQVLFLVPISNNTGHIMMAQLRSNIETALPPGMNKHRIHIQIGPKVGIQ
jgi:hypothetical protein